MPQRLLAFLIGISCFTGAAFARDLAAPEAFEAARAGKLTLIDIRTPPEWKETRVAQGAILINMIQPRGAQGFLDEVMKKVGGNKTAPIALICRTGNRTSQVLRYLQSQGFTNAAHIPEGMAGSRSGPGWLARRLPTESCSVC